MYDRYLLQTEVHRFGADEVPFSCAHVTPTLSFTRPAKCEQMLLPLLARLTSGKL